MKKYQPKKDKKRNGLLYLGLLAALVLLIPLYLVLDRWVNVNGIDILYILLCCLTILIFYFFPQLLFWQTIQIDANYITVRRSGFVPDKLVFPKSEVAYCRLDAKNGLGLTQQWKDPELKDGAAIAFVLKNDMKITSDKMYFDETDFEEFKKILPNFVRAEDAKYHNPTSGKKIPIRHSRQFIIAAFGILMLGAAYVAYKIAFAGGGIW